LVLARCPSTQSEWRGSRAGWRRTVAGDVCRSEHWSDGV